MIIGSVGTLDKSQVRDKPFIDLKALVNHFLLSQSCYINGCPFTAILYFSHEKFEILFKKQFPSNIDSHLGFS